jgi:predicted nucleic acid-binding protein
MAGHQQAESAVVTTVTQAELLDGVAVLPAGRRREQLRAAVAGMLQEEFAGRLLPFDGAAAFAYAKVAAERRQAGSPISQFDAQIAAICRSRDGALATRNAKDFEGCGTPVVNPWSS